MLFQKLLTRSGVAVGLITLMLGMTMPALASQRVVYPNTNSCSSGYYYHSSRTGNDTVYGGWGTLTAELVEKQYKDASGNFHTCHQNHENTTLCPFVGYTLPPNIIKAAVFDSTTNIDVGMHAVSYPATTVCETISSYDTTPNGSNKVANGDIIYGDAYFTDVDQPSFASEVLTSPSWIAR